MTGFTETFVMATGFLIVCLLAGFLVPKIQHPPSATEPAEEVNLTGAATEGVGV